MAFTIGTKREYELLGNDNNNDPCIFPRFPVNAAFVQAFDFRTKQIAEDNSKYLAFPYIIRIGTTLVGIYSEGDSHAASDRQIMIRSDNYGLSWSSVTFFENATGVFNFSLLVGVLAVGATAVFKVWSVKNTAGTMAATTVSSVSYGGVTYAMWSRPVPGPGGKLYRTGYGINGADTQTALFESSDSGVTWVGKSVIFAEVGKFFNEADIVNTSGTNWMAIVREDSGASNPLYKSLSTDDGVTWGAATLLSTASLNGRQPNLIKMADNSIILCTSDRSGGSGYAGSAGDQVFGFDTTGITIFRSTDAGVTWSFRTRISPMYSTDGGQPFANETTAGRICVVYYVRKTTKAEPVIASASLNVENL